MSHASCTATGSDPEDVPISFSWDLDGDGTFETPGQTITVEVTDVGSLSATSQVTVSVNNGAPSIGAITAPFDPVPLGTEIAVSADFSDLGVLDTHTALFAWGDGTSSAGTIVEAGGSGSASATHTYASPGVYTVTLTVTDDDDGSDESLFQFVVIFDPEGGFATGGGWINSPLGAYIADPTLKGKVCGCGAPKLYPAASQRYS